MQKSFFLVLLLGIHQCITAALPEIPHSLKAAIINLIQTPRPAHAHFSHKKSRLSLCTVCNEIVCIEQTYENELFSFIFTPAVGPKDAQNLTLHVTILRDLLCHNGPIKNPDYYLDLIFLPHEQFEHELGIKEIPITKKKRSTPKIDNDWRYVLSDFECLKQILAQFKLLMEPDCIIKFGKVYMHKLATDYADSLIEEDTSYAKLVQETQRLSAAASSFSKSISSKKRIDHQIFEAKMRQLKLFKKVLKRYLRSIPNSFFLELPDGWLQKSSCKKKRINTVILAINVLSDEILEKESAYLAQLTQKRLPASQSTHFFDGCFGI
jgi:hypothetical protein